MPTGATIPIPAPLGLAKRGLDEVGARRNGWGTLPHEVSIRAVSVAPKRHMKRLRLSIELWHPRNAGELSAIVVFAIMAGTAIAKEEFFIGISVCGNAFGGLNAGTFGAI